MCPALTWTARSRLHSTLIATWTCCLWLTAVVNYLAYSIFYYISLLHRLSPFYILLVRHRRLQAQDCYGKELYQPSLGQHISDIVTSEKRLQAKLLAWVNTTIPQFHVTDFHTCWNDGVALCALLEAVCPGVCPHFDFLQNHYRVQNCRLGLQLANQHLNIPTSLIGPEEIAIADKVEGAGIIYRLVYMIRLSAQQQKWTPVENGSYSLDMLAALSRNSCVVNGTGITRATVGNKSQFTISLQKRCPLYLKINILGPVSMPQADISYQAAASAGTIGIAVAGLSVDLITCDTGRFSQLFSVRADDNGDKGKQDDNEENGSFEKVPYDYKLLTNGKSLVSYVPRNSGIHYIHVQVHGLDISGSPFRVVVTNPILSRQNSKQSLLRKSLSADTSFYWDNDRQVTVKKLRVVRRKLPNTIEENSEMGVSRPSITSGQDSNSDQTMPRVSRQSPVTVLDESSCFVSGTSQDEDHTESQPTILNIESSCVKNRTGSSNTMSIKVSSSTDGECASSSCSSYTTTTASATTMTSITTTDTTEEKPCINSFANIKPDRTWSDSRQTPPDTDSSNDCSQEYLTPSTSPCQLISDPELHNNVDRRVDSASCSRRSLEDNEFEKAEVSCQKTNPVSFQNSSESVHRQRMVLFQSPHSAFNSVKSTSECQQIASNTADTSNESLFEVLHPLPVECNNRPRPFTPDPFKVIKPKTNQTVPFVSCNYSFHPLKPKSAQMCRQSSFENDNWQKWYDYEASSSGQSNDSSWSTHGLSRRSRSPIHDHYLRPEEPVLGQRSVNIADSTSNSSDQRFNYVESHQPENKVGPRFNPLIRNRTYIVQSRSIAQQLSKSTNNICHSPQSTYHQQGTHQQSTHQHGKRQRGTHQQSTCQQGTCQQGICQQGMSQQNTHQQGACQQSSCQQGACQLGTCHQGACQQGTCHQGACQQSMCQLGAYQQNTHQRGSCQKALCQHNTHHQGTCQHDTHQQSTCRQHSNQWRHDCAWLQPSVDECQDTSSLLLNSCQDSQPPHCLRAVCNTNDNIIRTTPPPSPSLSMTLNPMQCTSFWRSSPSSSVTTDNSWSKDSLYKSEIKVFIKSPCKETTQVCSKDIPRQSPSSNCSNSLLIKKRKLLVIHNYDNQNAASGISHDPTTQNQSMACCNTALSPAEGNIPTRVETTMANGRSKGEGEGGGKSNHCYIHRWLKDSTQVPPPRQSTMETIDSGIAIDSRSPSPQRPITLGGLATINNTTTINNHNYRHSKTHRNNCSRNTQNEHTAMSNDRFQQHRKGFGTPQMSEHLRDYYRTRSLDNRLAPNECQPYEDSRERSAWMREGVNRIQLQPLHDSEQDRITSDAEDMSNQMCNGALLQTILRPYEGIYSSSTNYSADNELNDSQSQQMQGHMDSESLLRSSPYKVNNDVGTLCSDNCRQISSMASTADTQNRFLLPVSTDGTGSSVELPYIGVSRCYRPTRRWSDQSGATSSYLEDLVERYQRDVAYKGGCSEGGSAVSDCWQRRRQLRMYRGHTMRQYRSYASGLNELPLTDTDDVASMKNNDILHTDSITSYSTDRNQCAQYLDRSDATNFSSLMEIEELASCSGAALEELHNDCSDELNEPCMEQSRIIQNRKYNNGDNQQFYSQCQRPYDGLAQGDPSQYYNQETVDESTNKCTQQTFHQPMAPYMTINRQFSDDVAESQENPDMTDVSYCSEWLPSSVSMATNELLTPSMESLFFSLHKAIVETHERPESACYALGPGLEHGYVSTVNFFQVRTVSGYGPLTVGIRSPHSENTVLETCVLYSDDCTYEVSYRVSAPGCYTMNVKWAGYHIPQSPFFCKILPLKPET